MHSDFGESKVFARAASWPAFSDLRRFVVRCRTAVRHITLMAYRKSHLSQFPELAQGRGFILASRLTTGALFRQLFVLHRE